MGYGGVWGRGPPFPAGGGAGPGNYPGVGFTDNLNLHVNLLEEEAKYPHCNHLNRVFVLKCYLIKRLDYISSRIATNCSKLSEVGVVMSSRSKLHAFNFMDPPEW